MASEYKDNAPAVIPLYASPIRAGIQSGDLATLKTLLAQAETLNRQQGDIRGALTAARIAHIKLKAPR